MKTNYKIELWKNHQKQCEYPEYNTIKTRLKSFVNWPNRGQNPETLSEAGFFYTGRNDRIVCFCCSIGLKEWQSEDDAWKEHAIWSTKCDYLKFIKGSKFIIKAKNDYFRKKYTKDPKMIRD